MKLEIFDRQVIMTQLLPVQKEDGHTDNTLVKVL